MADADTARAEFSALRSEILTHTSVQQGILTITVGLAGTLVGFVVDKDKPELLFALAPAAFLLGAAYCEETRKIFVLAAYIRQVLDRQVPGLGTWETSGFRNEMTRALGMVLPAVVFGLVPIGAQLWAAREAELDGEKWTWAATGVAGLVLLLSLAISYYARPTRQRNYPEVSAAPAPVRQGVSGVGESGEDEPGG